MEPVLQSSRLVEESQWTVIAGHLKSGTPLEEYEKLWKKQMGKVMANSKRSFKIGSLLQVTGLDPKHDVQSPNQRNNLESRDLQKDVLGCLAQLNFL